MTITRSKTLVLAAAPDPIAAAIERAYRSLLLSLGSESDELTEIERLRCATLHREPHSSATKSVIHRAE